MPTHIDTERPVATPCRSLFTPWADVLLLGGGSVLALIMFKLLRLSAEHVAQLAIVMLVLANFVNHPHFAYSYQLFYGSWEDVKNGGMPPELLKRWWLAGFIAPIIIMTALITGALLWINGHPLMLGVCLNVMGLLVGWHYVKQGFGMAMMDAALKRHYWPAATRNAMLMNAYACWGAAWTLGNSTPIAKDLWGVLGISVNIPGSAVMIACLIASGTTLWFSVEIYRAIKQWKVQQLNWRQLPLAGLTAYLVTLYIWMGLTSLDAAFVLTIPFFHSLQYLTVIGRYKGNEAKTAAWSAIQLLRFALTGALLGAIGFWLLPGTLEYARTGALPTIGGTAVAVACCWIFINVHHYLIDNVLWRQGNPKVKKYLFEA